MARYPRYANGSREFLLDDIYGVLSDSLAEGAAEPNENWRNAYNRAYQPQSSNLRSNVVNLANGIRQRGNASTAARGNSNS